MPLIEVQGFGRFEFPDDMSQEDIKAALDKEFYNNPKNGLIGVEDKFTKPAQPVNDSESTPEPVVKPKQYGIQSAPIANEISDFLRTSKPVRPGVRHESIQTSGGIEPGTISGDQHPEDRSFLDQATQNRQQNEAAGVLPVSPLRTENLETTKQPAKLSANGEDSPFKQFLDKTFGGEGKVTPEQSAKALVEFEAGRKGMTAKQYKEQYGARIGLLERGLKDFGSGAISSGGGMLQYLSRMDGSAGMRKLTDKIMQHADDLMPSDPNFVDQLVAGFGSTAAFFVPGIGIAKGTESAYKLAPRMALWLGAGASGGLEAAAEAGGVYQTMLGQGKSPAEAAKAADTAFWQNAFLVTVTDRFGLFGDRGTRMMRRTLAGVNEGVLQEGGQQIISNILTGKPWHEGVPTSMAIGAIVGTTLGGNVNTPVENLAQEFDSNIKQANIPESYTDKFVRDLLNPSNAQVKATPPETRAPKYGLDTRKPMKPAETDVYYENTLDDARKRQAEEDAAYQQKQAEEAAVKSQDEPKVEKALTKKQKREQFQKEREYGLMLEAKKEGQTAVADLEVKQSIEAEENQQPTAMGLALKAAIQKKGGVEFPKADEVKPEINSEMDKSAHAAATSPTNNLPEPTLAQKEAGNYKKGHHTLQGLDITIENPQGSTRSGVSQDGKAWSSTLRSHYGYIKRSLGNDGDQVDVFLGKDAETAPNVFVVNQVDPETGKFDEHKVMIGYGDQYKARKAYLDNYEKGWKGLESIQKMSMPEFKSWLKTGNTQAPVMPEDVRAISKRLKAEKKQKMLSSDRNPNPKTDELKVAIAKLGGLNRSEAKSQGIDPANFTISGHKIKRVFTEEGMSFDEMAESLAQHGYPVFDEKGNYSPNALLDSLEKSIVGEKIMATVGHENLAAASEPEQDPFEARYGAWAEQKTTEDKLAWLMAAHGEDRIDEARERVAIQFPDVSDAEFNGRLIATLRGETYEENDAGRNKDDAGAGESHGAGEEARQGNYRQAAKTGTTDAEIDDIPFSRKRDDEESGPQQSVATKHADQKSRIWFPRFASPELKARVKEHAGTNWAREVKRSFVFRHEIQQLAEGNMSLGEALALTSTRGGELVHTKLAKMLSEKGWEGAWEYIEKDVHVIGGASKPAMAVNSSFVNCNPSKACAKFCYAAQGMPTYPAAKAKQELLDVLAERDPARLADIIAKDFKSADKAGRAWRDTALRLFDVGDGNEAWVKVVKQLNKRGIRVHVFSKNPDFLMKLDKRNIRLLSVDGSNAHLAEGNDLPLSIVYTGIKDLPLLQKYQHRIDSGEGGVILPEDSALKGDDIEAIPDDLARFVCPFDKGKKKTWSCLSCDNGKGIGCYADSITHNEHFGGVRSIKRTLDKHTRRVEKEDLSHAELDELEDHFRKQLEAIKRLRAEAARRAGEAGDRGDLSREGAEARTNQQEVEENKGLYAGYERETGNVSERKRGEGVSQESADAGQGQMSLFDTDGLPEAEAKTQVKDNFLVHYHQVATTYFRSGIDTINTPEEAAHVVAPLRKHAQESMLAVVTDKDGKILNVIRHTKGTKDGSTVEPVIVAGAIASTNGAKNVWFAHNHPSGVVDPSQADINITGKLKDALDATGIKVKGHIIVGSGMNAWHFTTKRGALGGVAEHSPIKIHAKPRKHSIGLTERVIKKNAQNGRPAITSPDSAIDVVSEMDADNAIVLLDNRHQLAGSISMTPDEMMSLREGGRVNRILKAIDSTNATATLVVSTDHGAARNVARYLNGIGGIRVLDAIIKDNGKYTASSSNGLMIESDKGPFFMRNRESGNNPAQAKQGASGDKQRRIERLRWEISKYLKEPLAEDHFEAVQVPDALAGAIEAIEKTFQQPVTIFRNHNPKRFDFDGVMLRGENGGIYVNVNNKNPVVSIVGHELLHAMRREHPDLYQQLYDAAYPEMRGIEKYREWLDAAHEKDGYAPVSDSILHEEILGDFMGDQFMEPEFWRKVGEHNPSLLKRVYVAIRKFLSDTLKRARTLGSAQYFKDIEKVQDTLAKVVAEFADRNNIPTLGETAFSRSEPKQIFYSQMLNVMGDKLPGKGTGGSYLAAINGYVNKGQIKPEEFEWSGIEQWLKDHPGKLTKEQVLEYMRQNQVQVQEVMLGDEIPYYKYLDLYTIRMSDPETIEPDSDYVDQRADEIADEMRDDFTDEDGEVDEIALHESAQELAWNEAYEDASYRMYAKDADGNVYPEYEIHGDRIFDTYNVVVNGEFIEQYSDLDDAEDALKAEMRKGISNARTSEEIDELEAEQADLETKFDQYTLPGGKNYRELLLTLPKQLGVPKPNSIAMVDEEMKARGLHGIDAEDRALLMSRSTMALSMLDDWEARLGVNVNTLRRQITGGGEIYASSHFEHPNILAHVRFDERTDADGKKVLFVQEVQSDWHQDGRKNGYRSVKPIAARLAKEYPSLPQDRSHWTVGELREQGVPKDMRDAWAKELVDTARAVPNAPFKKTWPLLTMKRMIRYAAENGFDRIAWTTGEQQADRYDLSHHIDNLEYAAFPQGDGSLRYQLTGNRGTEERFRKSGIEENELANYVGKDLAEKIINRVKARAKTSKNYYHTYDRGEHWGKRWVVATQDGVIKGEYATEAEANKAVEAGDVYHTGVIKGLDLKIGGDGMKAFYDKMLPSEVNKYVKKWGAKVFQDTFFHKIEEKGRDFEANAIDITDSMRESAIHGQPLFSRRREGTAWTVPDENLKDRFARKIQDKFQHIFMLQNTIRASGGHIDMNSDVYAAEERMHGKIEQDLLHLEEAYIEPIAQKLSEYDIDMENIDTYLIAKHAQERNEYIASIRDDMPDGGSGMTTREARGIVQTIENSPKAQQYRELAALVYNMLAHKRDVLRRSGLMSVDAVDQWRDNYQYYVPLKGWAEDAINDSFPRIGKGLSIKGKESKKAAGRRSLAYSPVVQAIQDTTESLIRARKNEVGKHILNLAMENPNPAYWQIFTEDNADKEMRNVNGKVRETPVAMHSSTKYFGVKVDGKQYYIKMIDPRLERAVNNLGIEKVNSVIKVLGSVNRFLSSVNTSLNPEFVLSNFMRDIQTAIYNVLAEQDLHDAKIGGEHIQGKMIRDVPKALRAIYTGLRGNGGTGEFDQYFQDFLADGAKTGYFDSRSLEQQKDHVLALIKMNRKGVGSKAEKVARDAMKFIEDVNTAVENGVRLSAYINARKALESRGVNEDVARKKAAHLAKNLTVNFNRRGEWSTVANSLYMFFNASVQGSAQFARTVLTPKKTNGRSLPIIGQYRPNTAQKMAIGMFLLAIALAELNRAASDDDKDGNSVYDNIPGHIKERNIIIMKSIFGGKGDEYWTIPLPYGYNIFHVLGTTIDDVVSGPKEKLDGATDIMQAVLGSFNPIGMSDSDNPGITILKTLTPTILTPGVELTANENFFGGPIYREDKYNSRTPDSSLSMSTTKEHYKIFSQWLNEVTGGNMYERGYVDISPDSIEHWAEFFTGGTGRFIDKSVSAATKVANDVPLRDREIPFWRKISGQRDEYFQERSYYDRRDIALAKLEAFDAARGVDRIQYRMENGNWLQLANLSKAYDKRLKRYRKKLHAVRDDDSLDMKTKDEKMREYRAKMEKIYGQFNTKYYELIEKRGKSIHQDNEPE